MNTSHTFSKSLFYPTWSSGPTETNDLNHNFSFRSNDPSHNATVRSHDPSNNATPRSQARLRHQSHGTLRERSTGTEMSKRSLKSNATYLRLNLITNSKGLVQLDLSKHQLKSIPIEVFLFPRLEVLKLSQNFCKEIPLAVSRLRSLKFLYLEDNSITFLPETLPNCINLVEINLTKNKLAALPTSIGMLKNLRVLRIGQNEFECLPHEIGDLENLRYLDVHGNVLWYLPFSVGKLHKLKYLNLSNNRFEHLPLPVCKIKSLHTLTLRGNFLTNLLPDFDSLQNLQELNLAYNRFDLIPQCVFRLRALLYLNLTGNHLESIPNTLTMLKSLQVLHLQGNQLDYIPDLFPNLMYLNVSNNKLYNFSVVHMKRLKSLNANYNYLENIPMGMYSCVRLQSVRLNTNQIRYIATDIVNLKKLRTLDLGNNMLVNVPQVLQQFDRLDYFNVRGNNISSKIQLHNGEVVSSADFYKKRRMFQQKQKQSNGTDRSRFYNGTPRSTRKGQDHRHRTQRSRSQSQSTISRASTFHITDSSHKMWDSADLLQNGFSTRHLETTSNSAYLKHKVPSSEMLSNGFHDNTLTTERSLKTLSSRIPAHEAALMSDSDDVSSSRVPVQTTDYQLLGICNQVEMLLNKQLLHPVLSFKGHSLGKSFTEKSIVRTDSGLWRISKDNSDLDPGVVTMTTETFTVTPQGGWLTSSHDSNISIFLPANAVNRLIQTQMKILKVKTDKLLELRQKNRLISNIISLGPIVYLKTLDNDDFDQQVTITIPVPTSDMAGHLHLLTIREDNSCVPSSAGFQQKSGYIVLKAWNLAGKAAILTRAKCKYKAAKSMEHLLNVLTTFYASNT